MAGGIRARLESLTIGQRIGAAVAIIMLLGLGALVALYTGLSSVNRGLEDISSRDEPLKTASLELEIHMYEAADSISQYVEMGSPEERVAARRHLANFTRFMDEYFVLVETPAERELGVELDARFSEFAELGGDLLAGGASAGESETAAAVARMEVVLVEMDRILDDNIQPRIAAHLDDSKARADASAARALRLAAFLIPAFILFGLFAVGLIARGIGAAIEKISQGTQAIAAGEFGHRVDPEGAEELADLARDFNRMAAELGVSRERLEYLASHDPLTGLANRAAFQDRLHEGLARSDRSKTPLALMFLDLDGFKEVNDQFGHDAGDLLLKIIGQRLRETVRQVDTVARLGGDEFTIILETLSHDEDAEGVATKVLTRLAEPVHLADAVVGVTGSIGIALYPKDGKGADELIRKADTAMYQAKASGRNNFKFYDQSLEEGDQRNRRRLRIAREQ